MTDTTKPERVWGKPFPVNGQRPEWLDPYEDQQMQHNAGYWMISEDTPDNRNWDWSQIKAIRLTTSHPHYAVQPPAAPSTANGDAPFTRLVADYLPEGDYDNQEPGWRIHDFPDGKNFAHWLVGLRKRRQSSSSRLSTLASNHAQAPQTRWRRWSKANVRR
jgi:hypothetical protein